MSLFAINAADIDAAGRSIDADLPVDWLDTQLADCEAHATAPGHLSVRLSRTGNEIVVRGKTTASLEAPCGRCLSPSKMDIKGDLSLLLQPAKTPPKAPAHSKTASKTSASASPSAPAAGARAPRIHRNATGKGSAADGATPAPVGGKGKRAHKDKDLPEYEFASDEADVDLFDGETVVLDDFVREAILLEIPIFPLCSEDCTGIRPASSDDAIDEGAEPRVDPRLAPLGALRAVLAQLNAGQGESTDDSEARPRSTSASHRKKTK